MARLRILAGQMRSALGSDVAVRTVYVAARLLGAASPASASPAEVTREVKPRNLVHGGTASAESLVRVISAR